MDKSERKERSSKDNSPFRGKRERSRSYKKKRDYKLRRRSKSRSSSSSRSRDNFDKKLDKMRESTRKNRPRKNSPKQADVKVKLPYKGILANLIQGNLKINSKLDNEEVERATDSLRRVDANTDRKV